MYMYSTITTYHTYFIRLSSILLYTPTLYTDLYMYICNYVTMYASVYGEDFEDCLGLISLLGSGVGWGFGFGFGFGFGVGGGDGGFALTMS